MRAPAETQLAPQQTTLSPQMKYTIRRLTKKFELQAGFLSDAKHFTLALNPRSDKSWWNHERRHIQIGIKGLTEENIEPIAYLRMRHERRHTDYTTPVDDDGSLGYPFSILNILEDARVEPIGEDCDFQPLHEYSHAAYYTEDNKKARANPFNIGVLLRWRKWGVQTKTEMPPQLTRTTYAEFLSDWERAIDRAIAASSTESVSMIARRLYGKWKELFQLNDEPGEGDGSGTTESSSDELTGNGTEGPNGETTADQTGDSSNVNDITEHFEDDNFTWDIDYINRQAAMLQKLLAPVSNTETVYTMYGKRFDPRRIENPPLKPFKRKMRSSRQTIMRDPVHIVIDGSGSMREEPFEAASHVARILSMVFPTVIDITTTESTNPIRIPIGNIDILRNYSSWGGGENYRSIGSNATGYSFTLFLTDAMVDEEDILYVKDTLRKLTKVGAGYVGQRSNNLNDVFDRNFHSTDMDDGIARMIALFIKRNFSREISTRA